MKYILGICATALMLWSMMDGTHAEYKIYMQVVAVALFFFVMMRLMDKAPSKFDKTKNEDEKNTLDTSFDDELNEEFEQKEKETEVKNKEEKDEVE